LGEVISQKNGRYFLDPFAKVIRIWDYMLNSKHAYQLMNRKIPFTEIYNCTTIFIPREKAEGGTDFDMYSMPIEDFQSLQRELGLRLEKLV